MTCSYSRRYDSSSSGDRLPLARPRLRLVELAAPQPQPGPHRGNRPHVRVVVAVVDAVRFVEELERVVEVAFGLPEPGHGDPPPVRVLRQPVVVAEAAADVQVLAGGREVVPLEQHPRDSDVHVGGSPQRLGAGRRRQVERPLVGAQRVAEPSLGRAGCRRG